MRIARRFDAGRCLVYSSGEVESSDFPAEDNLADAVPEAESINVGAVAL
jgi:hypothetical protein